MSRMGSSPCCPPDVSVGCVPSDPCRSPCGLSGPFVYNSCVPPVQRCLTLNPCINIYSCHTQIIFDPCVCTGMPCGACYPYSTKPCVASCNDIRPCSVCPGGGCSPCPAPVRPCPAPCLPPPVLPCLPPCPPCDKPATPVPCPVPLCDTVAIPCCRPNRCKPCPCYCCTEPGICTPKRCSYPGVPVCCGCRGPCMPVW